MKKRYLLGVFLLSCFIAKGQDSTIKSSVKNVEAKVDSVLALMTLEEKVGQLVQYNGSWDLTGPASEMNNKQKEENNIAADRAEMSGRVYGNDICQRDRRMHVLADLRLVRM